MGRNPSDQPPAKTKHLSHQAVRAAIAQGQQIEAVEQER